MAPGEEPDPRDESVAQRADRNLGELLQELRVAGLGVQVLFGYRGPGHRRPGRLGRGPAGD